MNIRCLKAAGFVLVATIATTGEASAERGDTLETHSVAEPRSPIPGYGAPSACHALLRAWANQCSDENADRRRCRLLERELERHGCELPRAEPPTLVDEIGIGLALFGVPVLRDDGLLFAATRSVPYEDVQGTPGYDYRMLALRSEDLGVEWGPVQLGGGSCAVRQAGRIRVPALSADGQRLYMHGDWNDGSSDYCAGLFMHDANTGAVQWRSHVGGPHPRHPISLDEERGLAYYGGHGGRFGAFDAISGLTIAMPTLPGRYGGGAGLTATGDFVATMAVSSAYLGRFGPGASLTWGVPSDAFSQNELSMAVGVDDDVLVAGLDTFRVFDGSTGDLRWSRAHVPSDSILVDSDGAIFVVQRTPDVALALEPDGAMRWELPLAEVSFMAFLDQNGTVLLQDSHVLRALDTQTGEEVWRFESVRELTPMHATLLRGGDILLSTTDGHLLRLAADLDYAEAPWPRARGNRFNSGRAWEAAPVPEE